VSEARRLPRFWILYLAWIAGCALLFLLMQALEMEDPSRRRDRVSSETAGEIALRVLEREDAARYAGYEIVNVAWAREREVAPDARWIVLLDRPERSGLDEAIVVEVEPRGGPIRMRKVFR
jgi:hypothetical protein